MKIKCKHCGRELRVGKKRCPHCKTAVEYPRKVKKRLTWFIKILIMVAVLCGAILFAWFAFGNILLLNIHGSFAAEELNSGSLEFTKEENTAYDMLPNYVKNMVEAPEPQEDGPIAAAMLPYISAEVSGVHGFFGDCRIDYTIWAPDLEGWLMNLDMSDVASAEQLLSMLASYIPTAPLRSETVTVSCYKDGIFSLRGIYDDAAFVNALYGGFNDAYAEFYARAMDEIREGLAK